jgi:hypothetical protein
MKKEIEKILKTSKVKLENLILICHFGSIHQFWLVVIRQNMSSGHVIEIQSHCKRLNAKIVGNSQSYALLIFSRHLGHQTPF